MYTLENLACNACIAPTALRSGERRVACDSFVIQFESQIAYLLLSQTMATLNMRLDDDLDRRLAREAELADQTRSELARLAITAYLSQRERGRFHAEIARAARDRGEDEARALAEEALTTDNEALALSEGVVAEPKANYRAKRKKR